MGSFAVKLLLVEGSNWQLKNLVGNHFLKTYSYCKSQYLLKRNSSLSTNRQARSFSLYYYTNVLSTFKYLMSLPTCTGIEIFRSWALNSGLVDHCPPPRWLRHCTRASNLLQVWLTIKRFCT